MKKIGILFVLALAYPGLVRGQITNPHQVVGSGATRATNDTYTLSGTVGQTATGIMPAWGGDPGMLEGFWYRTLLSPKVQCTASGTVTREVWKNVTGISVSSIPLNTAPTLSTTLTSLESPVNAGDNFGERIRGYLCAPETGAYTFYVSSDDHSELWLSTSADPAGKVKIASVSGWNTPKEWAKYASQKSAPVTLAAGQQYYFEVLHKDGTGGDNLAVGWQLPSAPQAAIAVVPGSRLSPYGQPNGRLAGPEAAAGEGLTDATNLRAYPNPFTDHLTLAFTATQTGPSTMVLLDAQGAPVRRLLHETVAAGTTKTVSVYGRTLRPGVYLVRLTTGGRVTHKRLLLVK